MILQSQRERWCPQNTLLSSLSAPLALRRSGMLQTMPHALHRRCTIGADRMSIRASVAWHFGQRTFAEVLGSVSAAIEDSESRRNFDAARNLSAGVLIDEPSAWTRRLLPL